MSVQISLELPEGVFSATRSTPEHFVKEMRLAAAVKWYEIGKISQAKAAEIAGISRYEFLEALEEFGISPFQVTEDELLEEMPFSRPGCLELH
jgi:predicted HTH domain antitoxin